ncbi:hypothetical protein BCM0100_1677 [Bacillus cereus]|nr:hypothetical protein BCM0100_1677 [Bacillus cereus]
MSTSKVLKGTALLSGATMISRILGFIYFFPFQLLVGTQGVALYGYAYSWYGILLSFSTAGIPIAVSKFVAKHNALGDYSTSKKLYNSSVKLMLFMGFLGFLVLFIGAPYISQFIIRSKTPDPQFIADVTLTMRALDYRTSNERYTWLFPRISTYETKCCFSSRRTNCARCFHFSW